MFKNAGGRQAAKDMMVNARTDCLSFEELVGRRPNDVESKNVPDRLFVGGRLPAPLELSRVSIVGTRAPSKEGEELARKTAEVLVRNNYAVVSGLAKGIDTVAHSTTIGAGGQTIAVLGTPLDKTYPAENAKLQAQIMEGHLAVSQFPPGSPVARANFVSRNRTMAVISDATVIVEAGRSSGTQHQGWEAIRLGRDLFVSEMVTADRGNEWAQKIAQYGAVTFSDPADIVDHLPPTPVIRTITL